jgi:hypothetical protein
MQSDNKFLLIGPPEEVNAASMTVTEIDCLNFDYCTILIVTGVTDKALTALTVTESDTPGSNHANVTGLIFGTSTTTDGNTSSLPTATDDNEIRVCEIDLRLRKRYLDVTTTVASGTAGANLCLLAILSRGDQPPFTTTERNIDELLRV